MTSSFKPFPHDLSSQSALRVVDMANVTLDGYSVSVAGEQLSIPDRLYAEESLLRDAAGPDAQPWIDALLTRHHDGFVRAKALKALLDSGPPWAPAYVVKLVGEYVIEIIDQIDTALDENDGPTYGAFLRENPEFLELTGQRVASYWDCYWRWRFSRDDYVGFRVMKRLKAMADANPP